jgi:hypothetical protein
MPEKQKQQDPGLPGGIFGILNKILDFLFDKFRGLPAPARAIAYFVLLAFFIATAWRLVAGQYLVRGTIFNGERFAQGCEVRVRSDYFSTNSKGMYYLVLSPAQYYRFLVSGELDLPVSPRLPNGDLGRERNFKVKLSWWDDEFTSIDLALLQAAVTEAPPQPWTFDLVPSAYAQEKAAARQIVVQQQTVYTKYPSSGDRLVVDRIVLGKSTSNAKQLEFQLELDGGSLEKALLIQGAEAGKLPARPKLSLGERYYFDVPQNRRGAAAKIEMDVAGFFKGEEDFKLRIPTIYNRALTISGTKGTQLVVRLMPRG